MPWIKPDFKEISLCMEVTAYVNAEDEMPLATDGEQSHPANQAVNDEETAQ